MTSASSIHPSPLPTKTVAVRACALGTVAAAVLVAVGLLSGLVPPDLHDDVLRGAGLAVVAGCLAAALQAWLCTGPADDPTVAVRFVAGLVVPFLLLAATAAVSCFVLAAKDTKFEALAAFAVTFVTAATVLHLTAVVVVSRALAARSTPPFRAAGPNS